MFRRSRGPIRSDRTPGAVAVLVAGGALYLARPETLSEGIESAVVDAAIDNTDTASDDPVSDDQVSDDATEVRQEDGDQ